MWCGANGQGCGSLSERGLGNAGLFQPDFFVQAGKAVGAIGEEAEFTERVHGGVLFGLFL